MEPIVNEHEVVVGGRLKEEIFINSNIEVDPVLDNKLENLSSNLTLGEKIDNTLDWINEFLNNSVIYVGDIYTVFTDMYDYIKNIIESVYIVKFKHPIKFD